MLLLRQQLQRLARGEAGTRSARTAPSHSAQRESPLHRVSALVSLGDLSQEDLGKSLIRALLAEEFGSELSNEPKFDRIVTEVHRMIAGDSEAKSLLDGSLELLRQSAKR